ncbi:MAG: hypothetical protein WCJ64_24005 [Rhodospirillaceae bacterium]
MEGPPKLRRRHLDILELLVVWFVMPHRAEALALLESAGISVAEADAAFAAVSAVTGSAEKLGQPIQISPNDEQGIS